MYSVFNSTFNVDLTTTNEQHINSDLSATFPQTFIVKGGSQYDSTNVFLFPYGYHSEGGGCIRAVYTKDNIKYTSVLGVNSTGVEYLVFKRETAVKDEVLAT